MFSAKLLWITFGFLGDLVNESLRVLYWLALKNKALDMIIFLSILDTFEDLGLVTFEIFAQSDDKTWPD